MANLNYLITRVCSRLNKNYNDTVVRNRVIGEINATCQENWISHPWSHRYREYSFPMIADVTTGTVSIVNGSQTVTCSSAVFDTTNHVGAYIRFTAESPQAFYRVVNVVSTTQLTIEPAYQGTTNSASQYELKIFDWLLPTECTDIRLVSLPIYKPSIPFYFVPDPPDVNRGSPLAAYIYSSDFSGKTYTTGTVTTTINSNVLTGIGTAWLANVRPGDTITITGDTMTVGSQTTLLTPYTVYKVVTDTQIILYQNAQASQISVTYTNTRQYGRYLRIQPTPNLAYTMLVGGYRDYPMLINNNDTNELTQKYPFAVEEGAVWREMSSSPDTREMADFKIQDDLWEKARADDRSMSPRSVSAPLFSNRPYQKV